MDFAMDVCPSPPSSSDPIGERVREFLDTRFDSIQIQPDADIDEGELLTLPTVSEMDFCGFETSQTWVPNFNFTNPQQHAATGSNRTTSEEPSTPATTVTATDTTPTASTASLSSSDNSRNNSIGTRSQAFSLNSELGYPPSEFLLDPMDYLRFPQEDGAAEQQQQQQYQGVMLGNEQVLGTAPAAAVREDEEVMAARNDSCHEDEGDDDAGDQEFQPIPVYMSETDAPAGNGLLHRHTSLVPDDMHQSLVDQNGNSYAGDMYSALAEEMLYSDVSANQQQQQQQQQQKQESQYTSFNPAGMDDAASATFLAHPNMIGRSLDMTGTVSLTNSEGQSLLVSGANYLHPEFLRKARIVPSMVSSKSTIRCNGVEYRNEVTANYATATPDVAFDESSFFGGPGMF